MKSKIFTILFSLCVLCGTLTTFQGCGTTHKFCVSQENYYYETVKKVLDAFNIETACLILKVPEDFANVGDILDIEINYEDNTATIVKVTKGDAPVETAVIPAEDIKKKE